MTPAAIKRERAHMRKLGFHGVPAREPLWVWSGDRTHYMAARIYTLPRVGLVEPQDVPYVEFWETHDRRRRARIVPARDVVHLAINVDNREITALVRRGK